jgi:hypothetical protein
MEPLNIFQRFFLWVSDLRKRIVCSHPYVTTGFTSRMFLEEGWIRCCGVATCKHCGLDFMVCVPAEGDEMDADG